MQTTNITPGATLKLKPARMKAYGLSDQMITVTSLKQRPGYKVPWVESDGRYFKPSDFSGVAG